MRMFLVVALAAGFLSSQRALQGSEPTEIVLWPAGHPEPRVSSDPAEILETGKDGLTRRFNVSSPRLFVHLPEPDKATGAVVIVVPGGGFGRLADEHEGSDVCRWLTSYGIAGIQLAYRTPTNKQAIPVEGPAQDLQKAIVTVRERSKELNIDPDRVGVIGFSAGGQTALVATAGKMVISFDGPREQLKPNALLLIYPYQVLNQEATGIRSDVNLDHGMPPTFIAQAVDDKASPPEGSAMLFTELVRRKIPAELHIYETGGHGFGMRPRPGAPGSKDWSNRAMDWLQLHKFTLDDRATP